MTLDDADRAEMASLRVALQAICDDAVGQADDPLWIVQTDLIQRARAVLARLAIGVHADGAPR